MTYADTGFIASLYLREVTSAAAIGVVSALAEPIAVCWLTELELENALLRAAFTQRISLQDATQLKAQFEANKTQGAYASIKIDGDALHIEAARLARHFTPSIGTRTLDLLHVAAANLFQCQRFLSFDDRQRKAAAALGMTVLPV